MNLFGKKKKELIKHVPNAMEALNELRVQIDCLEKKEMNLQIKIEEALKSAINKKHNKDMIGAKHQLHIKKIYNAELLNLASHRCTLSMQSLALESASVTVDTFRVLEKSNATMKEINSGIDVDKIDDLMDELKEQEDLKNEIDNVISRPCQDIFNDPDLAAELEALGENEKKIVNVPKKQVKQNTTVFHLPAVPQKVLQNHVIEESEDDRNFRELQQLMFA